MQGALQANQLVDTNWCQSHYFHVDLEPKGSVWLLFPLFFPWARGKEGVTVGGDHSLDSRGM